MPDQTAKAFRVQKLAPAERFGIEGDLGPSIPPSLLLRLLPLEVHAGESRIFRDAQAPVRVITQRSKHVGTKDRASNKRQDAKGKDKETVGSAVGNKELENKGKADQAKAGLKDAGEDVKDAAHKVKDAVTR